MGDASSLQGAFVRLSAPAAGPVRSANGRTFRRPRTATSSSPIGGSGGNVMPRVEEIVRAYRNADAQERMDTYLGHPGLRGRFDEIEREEERGSRSGEASKGTGRL